MPTIRGKTPEEMAAWVVVTTLTNLSIIPVIVELWRRRKPFAFWLAWFTFATSFLYHLCDSLERPIYLSEGRWHILDNIGAISSFCAWFVYLADVRDPVYRLHWMLLGLAITLVAQVKNPWDLNNTVGPIALFAVGALVKIIVIDSFRVPPYHRGYLARCLACLAVAIGCFVRALDDQNDPYRAFHGLWHFFVGLSSFYGWKLLPDDDVRPIDKRCAPVRKKTQ
jgi:hypothetical protein